MLLVWGATLACATAAWAQHAAPPAEAQCPPEFEAEQVSIEERGPDVVMRLTRAERARLKGDWLEGDQVEVWVPAHAGGRRPAWSMKATWLRRSLMADEASFGPLTLRTADGAWLDAHGGAYDGAARTLRLVGPVHVREWRAQAEAAGALLLFAPQSADIEEVALEGDVRGQWRLGAVAPQRPAAPLR